MANPVTSVFSDVMQGKGRTSIYDLPWHNVLFSAGALGSGLLAHHGVTRLLRNSLKAEQEARIKKLHKQLDSEIMKSQLAKTSSYALYKNVQSRMEKNAVSTAAALMTLGLGVPLALGTVQFLDAYKPRTTGDIKSLKRALNVMRARTRPDVADLPPLTFQPRDVIKIRPDDTLTD